MSNDQGSEIGREIHGEIDDLLHHRAQRGDERGADAVWRAAQGGNTVAQDRSLTATSRLAVAAVLLVVAAVGVGLFASLTGNDSGLVITQTPGDTPPVGNDDEPSPGTDQPTDQTQPEVDSVSDASSQDAGEGAKPQDADAAATGGDDDSSTPAPDGAGDRADDRADDVPTTAPPVTPPSFGSGSGAVTDWEIFEQLGSVESARSESNGMGWVDYVTPGPEAGANGGMIRRTSSPHRFIDGRLVIEVDYAATVDSRGDSAWGEVVISANDRPTPGVDGAFYAAQYFPGEPTLGCRLQADRQVLCQLFDSDGQRIWQMSWFEAVGVQQTVNSDPQSWLVCGAGAPGTDCLNRFRIELTADSVLVTVNGETVLHQTGVPGIPSTLVDDDVYLFASSLLSRHDEPVARFDWGSVRVNAQP